MMGVVTRRKLIASAAATAAVALSRPSILRAATDELTIGFVPGNAIYWDFDVALEKGFFQNVGFNAQSSIMQSSPHSIQQAITGAYQIAAAQPEPFVAAVARGADNLAAIAAPMNRADWCLNVRPEIHSLAELKGKVIGVSALRNSEIWLTQQILVSAGLKKDEVDFLVVGTSPAKMTALAKGSIAATVLFQPTAELAIREGFPALARYGELRAYPSILYVVDKKWAAVSDRGKRIGQVIGRAHEWLWDPANRAEAVNILMKITKRDQATIDAIYNDYFVRGKIYSRHGEIEMKGLAHTLADMAQDGEVLKGPAPEAKKFVLDHSLGGLSV